MMCTLTIKFLSHSKNPTRPRHPAWLACTRGVRCWQESDKTTPEQKHEKTVKLIPSSGMIKHHPPLPEDSDSSKEFRQTFYLALDPNLLIESVGNIFLFCLIGFDGRLE